MSFFITQTLECKFILRKIKHLEQSFCFTIEFKMYQLKIYLWNEFQLMKIKYHENNFNAYIEFVA